MNIEQLQKLISSDGYAMSPNLKQRIMENRMTIGDVNFMEKSLMSSQLISIKTDLQHITPILQEASMQVLELKNNGANDVEINGVLNVFNDLTDHLVWYQSLVDDFGLVDVVTVEELD